MGVAAGLMQGRTGVFAERMQGRHLYVLRYSASVFSNSVSMLIATLGLSGHSNGYRATVAVVRNISHPFSFIVLLTTLRSPYPPAACPPRGPSPPGLRLCAEPQPPPSSQRCACLRVAARPLPT